MKCKQPWTRQTGRIQTIRCFKINSAFLSKVQYFFYLSRLEKQGSSYRGQNYIDNDLKGCENWFPVSGRFKLSRVWVIEGKITVNVWTKSTGNWCWFELARVRVIGIRLYKKFVDLFCIIFTLDLDQDISEVCAKFQRVSIIWFGEFLTESRVPFLTKFSSLCELAVVD